RARQGSGPPGIGENGNREVAFSMQFLIPLEARGDPLFRQVYAGLRRGILEGAFRAGERLPSTRDLAEQLRISRTVVVPAYAQLLAEGSAESRVGSGTYVPDHLTAARRDGSPRSARFRLSRFGAFAAAAASSVDFPGPRATPLRYDFAYGRSVVDCFPFEQ